MTFKHRGIRYALRKGIITNIKFFLLYCQRDILQDDIDRTFYTAFHNLFCQYKGGLKTGRRPHV